MRDIDFESWSIIALVTAIPIVIGIASFTGDMNGDMISEHAKEKSLDKDSVIDLSLYPYPRPNELSIQGVFKTDRMRLNTYSVDSCEYIVVINADSTVLAITHAGNCSNPLHRGISVKKRGSNFHTDIIP